MAKLSVIIPNYNHGRYLPDLFEAILIKQTRIPDEVIVVDDCSTDNSREILALASKQHPALQVHFSKTNQGAMAAVDKGLSLATGELIVLRAADDLDFPDHFQAVEKLMDLHPEAAICCGDVARFGGSPDQYSIQSLGLSKTPRYLSPEELSKKFGPQPLYGHGVVIRKSSVINAGGYDPKFHHLSDWFCFLAAAFRQGACYLPQPVVAIRQDHLSLGNQRANDESVSIEIFERLIERLNGDLSDIADLLLDSRALLFLGAKLHSWVEEKLKSANDPKALLARIYQIESRRNENLNTESGISDVIFKVLQNNQEKIRQIKASHPTLPVAVFGAGGHTEILLSTWRKLSLPPLDLLLSTDSSKQSMAFDLPLKAVAKIQPSPCIAVLSSQSFEPLFYNCMKRFHPDSKILSIWDPSLTQID